MENVRIPSLLPLADDEAQVWYAWTAPCDVPEWRAAGLRLLDAAERARMDRFLFDHLKLEFLVTRVLCRTILSRYAAVAPAQWRFAANAYGRPEIDLPDRGIDLRFNLSNTRSLVACVITRSCDAGIDVERTDRHDETVEIADHFFSPAEARALRATPLERQRQRFFEYWTLKESYIKARGMGLSIPLEKFSFEVESRPIRIGFDIGFDDRSEDWQFELFEPDPSHLMALGIRRGNRSDYRVVIEELRLRDTLQIDGV
jgi:4'-phosphopantetheinyl transferase